MIGRPPARDAARNHGTGPAVLAPVTPPGENEPTVIPGQNRPAGRGDRDR